MLSQYLDEKMKKDKLQNTIGLFGNRDTKEVVEIIIHYINETDLDCSILEIEEDLDLEFIETK